MSWTEVISDSTLDESISNKLRAYEIKRLSVSKKDPSLELPITYENYSGLISDLKSNSSQIELINLQNILTEKLQTELTNDELESLVNTVTLTTEKISSRSFSKEKLFKVKADSVKKRLKDFYLKLKDGFFIPTGFSEFDNTNVGIPLDSYFLIAGKTGSGKSSLSIQLAINMKRSGARVCILPLEMSIEQNLLRIGSNLTKIPIVDIVKDLKIYYKPVVKALADFIHNDDSPACIHFYEPDIDETLDKTLVILKPMDYDIIIIDYINLMAPMGGDNINQALSLNLASRYAKRYASIHKTIICMLAQLDDEADRVRYSRALAEDASNYWLWLEDKDTIAATECITIYQKKARNQNPIPFKLKADLKISRYSDWIEDQNSNSSDSRKTKRLSKDFDDLEHNSDVPTDDDI